MSFRSAAAVSVIAVCLAAGSSLAQVNVAAWLSADNRYDLYVGTGTGTTTMIGGVADWTRADLWNLQVSTGYIYVASTDFGAPYGLGGYLSIDGGEFLALLPGSGWESYVVPGGGNHPSQAVVDSSITDANAGNLWAPVSAGTAVPGFGLPHFYGSLPAQGCIWDPRSQGGSTVIFRYSLVPAPGAVLPLAGSLLAFRRRRA
ncbi:MAG: hypothetical protein DYG92_08745 [Leptolyngbya sp. PLA1]|nr:hypothetical protein [Leptolyngbya sp. PLA1]